MDIMGICMVEVEGIDMLEERPEDQSMDIMEKRLSNNRSEVEGTDMEVMNIVDDMTAEVVERKHESVVLVRHYIGDGVERHR
jgi:hypothetical protein